MIWARRVALNGMQLDEVHEAVVIRSVEPADGKESIAAVANAAGYGQRITNRRRDTLDMVVRFAILVHKTSLAERAAVLEAVNAWAAAATEGAWLTVNYKPNRRLWVVLAQAPGEGSLWDFTKEFQITFRAYVVPYWEDETEISATSGVTASGRMAITVPGSAKSEAKVTVTNRSGMNIPNLSVTVAGQTMTFTDVNLGGGQSLVVDHVQTGRLYYLRAMIGNTSVLAKRTGANDFTVSPGENIITFSADRAVQVTVRARGRYL